MKIQKDKVMHFTVCMVMAAAASLMFAFLAPWYAAMAAGFMLAMAAGGAKEYGDMLSPGNHWDWWDVLADTLGAAVGCLTGLVELM